MITKSKLSFNLIKKIIFIIFLGTTVIHLTSCHPSYKRLTRNGWGKDTVLVKFYDLPKPILDTLIKYYEATFTNDTTDDIKDLISFDITKKIIDVAYYDSYSKKLRIPFGRYFKIGNKKYFIHYSELDSPIIYYDNYLFFPSKVFFDKAFEHKLYSQGEHIPYGKKYFIKLKL